MKINPETIYSNQIHNLDCVVGMAALAPDSADVVIADPPYNKKKDFGNNSDKRSLSDYVAWSLGWIKEALRVLKPCGALFIYGFPEILAHISVNLPLDKQRWLQWHYTNKNMPNLNFWQRSHESILCAWKDRPLFNRDSIREPYTRSYLAGCAGRVRPPGECRLSGRQAQPTAYQAHEKGALPRDVIPIPALAGGAALKERHIYCKTCASLVESAARKAHKGHDLIIHPTQKPIALAKKLILSCKPPGAFNILIPFCGSGSECVCARELGGNFVSFELNPDYILLAQAAIMRAGFTFDANLHILRKIGPNSQLRPADRGDLSGEREYGEEIQGSGSRRHRRGRPRNAEDTA